VSNANTLSPYRGRLEALKIVFPSTGKEFGLGHASFHPLFNRRFTPQPLNRTIVKSPELSLPKHDCAIITLDKHLKLLSPEERKELNDSFLRFGPKASKGLNGSLDDIELSVLIQTIGSTKKHGHLIIYDLRGRAIAKLFFYEGKIFHAQFRHLRDKAAVYQLLTSKIDGFFELLPTTIDPAWAALRPIIESPDRFILNAFRRLEGLESLRESVGGENFYITRARDALDRSALPSEIADRALSIWRVLDGLTPSGRIWELVRFDEYEIFTILNLLKQTGQILPSSIKKPLVVSSALESWKHVRRLDPLPLNPGHELALGDTVTVATVDSGNRIATPKHGVTVGRVNDIDPSHVIHSAPVLPEGQGCPIIKNGVVVGIHCGISPASSTIERVLGLLHFMLSTDSILYCLDSSELEYTRV
jgi:hypothetical protein